MPRAVIDSEPPARGGEPVMDDGKPDRREPRRGASEARARILNLDQELSSHAGGPQFDPTVGSGCSARVLDEIADDATCLGRAAIEGQPVVDRHRDTGTIDNRGLYRD